MKTFCQVLIIIILIAVFFQSLHDDFHAKPAREAFGFRGAVVTVLTVALFTLVLWKAGTFAGLLN